MVLELLAEYKGVLFYAMLVHPAWAAQAKPLLWRSVDLDEAFASIRGAPRRQLYAEHVCRLTVAACGDQIFVDDPPLRFPRLQVLHIDARTTWELDMKKRRTTAKAADDQSACVRAHDMRAPRRLYNCLAYWLTPSVTSVALVNFDDGRYGAIVQLLLQSKHITELGFHRGKGYCMARHLASVAAAAAADSTTTMTTTPPPSCFQQLRVLTADILRAQVAPMVAALRLAPQLTSLALLVPGERTRGVLPALAALGPTLQLLQLEFDSEVWLHAAELRALRALTQLRELVVQPPTNRTFCFLVVSHDFGVADLEQLLTSLPKLRRFVFGGVARWWRGDSGDGRGLLQRVGRAAPLLEELALAGSYSVQELDSGGGTTAAFPCLRTLILDQIALSLPLSVASRGDVEELRDAVWHDVILEVKASIRHHMPHLRSLSLSAVEPFYCRIIDWVVRTHDTTDPLALDDEEDEDEDDDMGDDDGVMDKESIIHDLFPSGVVTLP